MGLSKYNHRQPPPLPITTAPSSNTNKLLANTASPSSILETKLLNQATSNLWSIAIVKIEGAPKVDPRTNRLKIFSSPPELQPLLS